MTGESLPPTASRVSANLAANFVGSGWLALTQLAVVPFYLRAMGAERFGLIGVWIVLQSASQILDLGLGTTANRELARHAGDPERRSGAIALARRLERLAWAAALAAGALVAAAAPAIATRWLQGSTLPRAETVAALRAMALLFALQFPLLLYQNLLNGLQLQVRLNVVRFGAASLSAVASVAGLALVAPTAPVLFGALAACALLQALTLRRLTWAELGQAPPGAPAADDPLSRVRGFAAGMAVLSITGFALGQMDKVVLSRTLPLAEFGDYALAASAAAGLYFAIAPVFAALFPRLSELLQRGAAADLRALYHSASQAMATLVLPAALVLGFHSELALRAWTGDSRAARSAALPLALLVAGTALNGLLHVPYALQLAAGWTRLAVRLNLVLLALGLPALVLGAARWGAVAGAAVWLGVNLVYFALGAPWTHRRLLPGATARWLFGDLGAPAAAAALVAGLARALAPPAPGRAAAVVHLLAAVVAATAAALLAGDRSRAWLGARLGSRRR
jgi:O-antigen/teichoic acid export membrane protein